MLKQRIISKIKMWVFIPKEPPKEYLEKWKKSMIDNASKMGENLKKSISGLGDYAQKMAKPNIKETLEWLKPDYRSKHGRTYKNIIDSMITNMPDGYNKFKDKSEQAFGNDAKEFKQTMEDKAYKSASKMARTNLPFGGYKNVIRGVGPFVARWLSGDLKVLDLVTPEDKEIIGLPELITTPERAGEFRKKLINRIKQAGAEIVRYGKFHQATIDRENALTNQLVNQFIRPDIEPFATGGASHIDFIILNTLLYFEIQVSHKT